MGVGGMDAGGIEVTVGNGVALGGAMVGITVSGIAVELVGLGIPPEPARAVSWAIAFCPAESVNWAATVRAAAV